MCSLEKIKIINSKIGMICGIDGTISNRRHPYKFTEQDYLKKLQTKLMLHPKIIVTHDTPAIINNDDSNDNNKKLNGNDNIFNLITKYKPYIHIYGHCHHGQYHYFINGTHYLCADSRIIVMIPLNGNRSDDYYIKQEFNDHSINGVYDMYDYYT